MRRHPNIALRYSRFPTSYQNFKSSANTRTRSIQKKSHLRKGKVESDVKRLMKRSTKAKQATRMSDSTLTKDISYK